MLINRVLERILHSLASSQLQDRHSLFQQKNVPVPSSFSPNKQSVVQNQLILSILLLAVLTIPVPLGHFLQSHTMLHVTPFPHFHQVKNPSTPLRLLLISTDNIIVDPDPRLSAHFASLFPTRLTIPSSPRKALPISETPLPYRQTDAFQVEHRGTAVAAQQIPLFLANRAAIFPLVRRRRRFRAQNRGTPTLRGRLPRGNLPLVGGIGRIRGIRRGIRRIRRRIRRRIGGKIRIRETPAVVRFIVRIRIEFIATLRRIRRRIRGIRGIRFEFHGLRPFLATRFRRGSRGFRCGSRGFRRGFRGRFARGGGNRGDLLVGQVDEGLAVLERAEDQSQHDFFAGGRH